MIVADTNCINCINCKNKCSIVMKPVFAQTKLIYCHRLVHYESYILTMRPLFRLIKAAMAYYWAYSHQKYR